MSSQNDIASKILKPLPSQSKGDTNMSTEIAPVNGDTNQLPEHLKLYYAQMGGQKLPTGLEDIGHNILPSYIKVVQKMARQELLDQFSVGDIIMVPENMLLGPVQRNDAGQALSESTRVPFTPLFGFDEYVVCNPATLSKSGQIPFIRERTRDPNSEIAQRAMSWEDGARQRPYPEKPNDPKLFIKYMQCLNFICVLHLEGLQDKPVQLSFTSTNFKNGRNFTSQIQMRGIPMYHCIFELYSKYQSDGSNDWYGMHVSNPTNFPAFVQSSDEAEKYLSLHKSLYDSFTNDLLRSNYGENEVISDDAKVVDTIKPQHPSPQQTTEQQAEAVF
jgi:hypothetical protein